MPLGTGNDFSRVAGWGGTQEDFSANCLQGMRKLVKQWIEAKEEPLDIWEVQVTTHAHGHF